MPWRIYTSFWDATKKPKTHDALRKDCNSDTKEVYIPRSPSCFIDNNCSFRPSENYVWSQARYFTCSWRTFTFITSSLKAVYRMIFPDVFSKKDVLLQICFILLEEYPHTKVWFQESWTRTSASTFSCKLANCRTPFLKNTSGWNVWNAFFNFKRIYHFVW